MANYIEVTAPGFSPWGDGVSTTCSVDLSNYCIGTVLGVPPDVVIVDYGGSPVPSSLFKSTVTFTLPAAIPVGTQGSAVTFTLRFNL